MRFLRYPGSKRKFLSTLVEHFPSKESIKGKYIEPFVGGGSVYLAFEPKQALLADINTDLIDLYRGIKSYPHKVWEIFSTFPKGKRSYYLVRNSEYHTKPIYYRAARILYLNRTCFKGMWRHGVDGNFNVGYGGEDRRWVIDHQNIIELSRALKNSAIINSDFESVLENVKDNDFIFLDPPYKPGLKEMKDAHYAYGKFTYEDQIRLSEALKRIGNKKIKWLMTNSDHKSIRRLYKDYEIDKLKVGTSHRIGISTLRPKEIIIKNY